MSTIVQNFGKNVSFEPAVHLSPADRGEVVAGLDRPGTHTIRALGGLHSWSEAVVSHDVVLDLRYLHNVAVELGDDGSPFATIDAGCTIDSVLDYLRSYGGYTLPTYGIIGKQTIAGAVSTATHGSGRASLSNYVKSVCVAAYDAEGKAHSYEWYGGETLRAARCALGCTGVLLSVRVPVEPDYLIEETTNWFAEIDDVLALRVDYPRQQFYLVPWSWRWFAQHRRAVSWATGTVPSKNALFRRILRFVGVDVGLNGAVRLLAGKLRWWAGIRWLYRRLFPLIAKAGVRVTDHARRILMMRHDLYTHVEMELFVPERHVRHAAAFVEWVLRWCGGESPRMPEVLAHDTFGCDAAREVAALQGSYVQDYLITFRRVLADDAMIAMTSGCDGGAWYAISLVTYQSDREPFLKMARFLATAMASAYAARPHWGKVCPLDAGEIAALYPELPGFRAHCASVDPNQAFVNEFARRVLGF